MSLCSQPRRDVVILAHLVWTAFRPLPPSIAAAFSFIAHDHSGRVEPLLHIAVPW
jgi:hypothetical protein